MHPVDHLSGEDLIVLFLTYILLSWLAWTLIRCIGRYDLESASLALRLFIQGHKNKKYMEERKKKGNKGDTVDPLCPKPFSKDL